MANFGLKTLILCSHTKQGVQEHAGRDSGSLEGQRHDQRVDPAGIQRDGGHGRRAARTGGRNRGDVHSRREVRTGHREGRRDH